MKRENKWQDRFDEKFYNVHLINSWVTEECECDLGESCPQRLKSFIQSEIDRAVAERDKEIVEWLKKRCESNIQSFGTDKWNSDMEDLINKLK
jgi:hypothetical protein